MNTTTINPPDIRDERWILLISVQHDFKHILLVCLSPCADWQLSNLEAGGAESSNVTIHHVLGWLHMSNCPSEVLVPRLLYRIKRLML